jgi:hypothetical protein
MRLSNPKYLIQKNGRKMMEEEFNSMEYEIAMKVKHDFVLNQCYDLIMNILEDNIIHLYTCINNFLFQDINYEKVVSIIPKWVADAGISPESASNKEFYEKMRGLFSHPYLNRFVYYYDLWSLVAALQDRLQAVECFMRDYYKTISCYLKFSEGKYTSCIRTSSQYTTDAFASLNSVFVSLASTFDILTKIAVEQYEFGKYDFAFYKKMRSSKILYNYTSNIINPILKADGLLFSAPLCVRKVLTFRDEYIHNGPWDLRCSLYETFIDNTPADVIMYSPDMDEHGNFISSGSRNKFYSQGNMINIQLPQLVMDTLYVIQNTIDQIAGLYSKETLRIENTELTQDCILAIAKYCTSLKEKMLDK